VNGKDFRRMYAALVNARKEVELVSGFRDYEGMTRTERAYLSEALTNLKIAVETVIHGECHATPQCER
jgi:hypothetical protein